MSEGGMPRGGSIILITFLLAMVLAIIPMPDWARYMRPEWAVLVLIYWCLALPTRVNVLSGWTVGLCLDVLYGSLLGQHAMALAIVAWAVTKMHQQIRVYPLWQQALVVFMFVALNQLMVVWVKGIIGQSPDSPWLYWLPSVTSAILWPWLFIMMRDVRRRFRVS